MMSMTSDCRSRERGGLRRASAPRASLAPLALIVLIAAQGCGGSSGGSTVTELCIDFAPAVAVPTSGTVSSRLSAQSTCQLAEIEILATDLNDIYAFKSTVKYNADVAAFLGFSLVGSVLEADGGDVTVVAQEDEFGVVTIGVTRIAAPAGVNVTGTGVLIKLGFARFALQGASGEFTLGAECLLNGATPPTPMAGLACSGGTLIVR